MTLWFLSLRKNSPEDGWLRCNALVSRLHTTLGSDAKSIEFRRGPAINSATRTNQNKLEFSVSASSLRSNTSRVNWIGRYHVSLYLMSDWRYVEDCLTESPAFGPGFISVNIVGGDLQPTIYRPRPSKSTPCGRILLTLGNLAMQGTLFLRNKNPNCVRRFFVRSFTQSSRTLWSLVINNVSTSLENR